MSYLEGYLYRFFQRNGNGLPSLSGPPYRMDSRHHEALFGRIDRAHAFDDPFWSIVAVGASKRELWEVLRSETYLPGSTDNSTFAAGLVLAGWLGVSSEWIDHYIDRARSGGPSGLLEQM